ncbi:MAG: hypothetical protein VKO26_09130 [Cyanobacteriota bacterium]|nr:hypothetical protein [Cyanobacteria bacterium K_Offshore_surface_m2_239]MEB3157583.1 hypothetical protein [Cyanobacteriota bacterium]
MARTPSTPLADPSSPQAAGLPAEPQLQDMNAEQALAFIGLGLMRKLMAEGETSPWLWTGEEGAGSVDVASLRQRLELVDLAVRTSAPLTTAEVTHLLGARPGAPVVERGGLLARRRGRNVWILSRGGDGHGTAAHFHETPRRRF